MSHQPTAQNLWGMKPPAVKVAKATPTVIVAPTFSSIPKADMQSMQMRSALRQALIPLGCAGADCLVR